MVFFFSRKSDDNAYVGEEKSLVQVIRTRFYGKLKGKEREATPSSNLRPTTSAPPSIHHARLSEIPTNPRASSAYPSSPPPSQNIRTSTNAITMVLAQRLNELAVANSEGLLNDDEYRLLRQNLFERFSSSTVVPAEKPLVPLMKNIRSETDATQFAKRPSSNFQVNATRSPSIRAPSIRSKSSISSGMTNLLRRTTGRRQELFNDSINDASSIITSESLTSSPFKRRQTIAKKFSNSSLHTETSQAPFDTMSISSRRTGSGSEPQVSPGYSFTTVSASRSTHSALRLDTPPSSFPSRITGIDSKHIMHGNTHSVSDEENLKTAKEIYQEILAVDAERKRLLDAFNGLELSTLTRWQRRTIRVPNLAATSQSPWPNDVSSTDRNHQPQIVPEADALDIMSIQSGTSATAQSMVYSDWKPRANVTTASSIIRLGLRRKNSGSSVSSGRNVTASTLPPVPSLPSYLSRAAVGSRSSLSLGRSTALSALAEDESIAPSEATGILEFSEDEDATVELGLVKIRKQREKVTRRYEARLEYLRAKLKGAELHEKLLKK